MDDCDPDFRGKEAYEDNLSCIDAAGNLVFRVSGLNNCQSVGSNHIIAADSRRGWIWFLEMVGNRIHKLDQKGKELLVIKDVKASALAVDPVSGNLWAIISNGTIYGDHTNVYDAAGGLVTTYSVSGFDIAYDEQAKSFWFAGPNLTKVAATSGQILLTKKIAAWCASSVAVDSDNGTIWATVRRHPNVSGSINALLSFHNDGTAKDTVELGEKDPCRVSVNRHDGSVWVTLWRFGVQHYSSACKLQSEHLMWALAADADPATNDVWVANSQQVIRMSPEGAITKRIDNKSGTLQAWIYAFEPFAARRQD